MADHLISEEKWLDAWLWYRGAPHQRKAIANLYHQIRQSDPCLLHEKAGWLNEYRSRDKLVHSFMHPQGE